MTDIPRRTLSELAFIYEFDPDRADVYVEGSFDSAIISWFASVRGLQGVAVYPVDAIDIPDGDIIEAGEKANNRERIVFLARFLGEIGVRRATCVADADFSRLSGPELAPEPPLFLTDYACMEMYLFCPTNFSKFFTLCCRRNDWPVRVIMDSLAEVLQEFFLYRYANDELGWGMDWLDKNVCLTLEEWKITLDSDEFIARLLNKNARSREKSTFVARVETLRPRLKRDARHQMNGHDLIALLTWYIRQKGVFHKCSHVDNVELCLTVTLDADALKRESMFREFEDRVSGTTAQ